MNTTIQENQMNVSVTADIEQVQVSTMEAFLERVEFNRFGIIAMLLIVIGCVGGYAAAVAIEQSIFHLAVVAISTVVVEAMILSVMPMRTILIASGISMLINLVVIVF